MAATDADDVLGPIDLLVIEWREENMTGEAAAALLDLVEQGIIRIFDLLVVRKDEDGTFSGIDIEDLSDEDLGGFVAFSGARSGLLGDDDVAEAANALEPGTMAALIVYENAWAVPFVRAARGVGAQVVARVHIPADDLIATLDALEAADG